MWQKEYKKEEFYWGLKPEKELKEVLKHTPKGVALDIGAGEGRNSIFLAKNGFEVEAIDKTKEGLDKCQKIVKKYYLPIKTKVIDVKKFKFGENKYSLVLSIAALDFLKLSEIKKIIPKIKKSLKKGGVFYLLVFSIKDPFLKKCKERQLKMIEKNTFYLPEFKTFRHFFENKEVLNLLKGLKIIKIEEKEIKDIHGGKVHFHWVVRVIVKKIGGQI
jgi:cyclopropane fatty-acyl-phospholipid synthase-like methyltransferase